MSAAAAPAAAPGRVRPSFPGAVRSELLKIGRQWLTWVLVAGFAVLVAIVMISFAASGTGRTALDRAPATFYFTYLTVAQEVFTTLSGIFLLVVGARLVSMEYGGGTIRIVLGRGTSRLGLLGAQYAALAVAGALLLLAYALASGVFLYTAVVAWHGSFAPVSSLPAIAWTDTWRVVLACCVSMAVCILLATAAAVVGRSVAFGVGVAVAFFPADNFGVIVMSLLTRLTHQDSWASLTQWFLGPMLNHLPAALQPDHVVRASFAPPLVDVTAAHTWIVIGVYALAFLAAAVVLTWRRDVLH